MLSRLGDSASGPSQRAGDLPISLSVYRATVSAPFRNSGANQTSTSPGAVDQTAQSSGVISDQESSKKDSPAEHLPKGKQTTGAVTPEERPLVPATSPDGLKDPAEKSTTVNSIVDSPEKENVLDQEVSTKGLPAEYPATEGQSTGTVTLKEREPLLAASSERGKAGAGEGTAVGPLENSGKEKPSIAQESLMTGSPVDHLLRDGRPAVAVNVGPRRSLLTMSSNRGETVVNGRTVVNTPRGTIGQEMPRYQLSYNSTITVTTSNLILCSRLPETPPDNTRHFCPDPMTKQGRDALLTKIYVVRHILYSCETPRLQALTVIGVSNPRYLLMLEIHFLQDACLDVRRHCARDGRVVRYLEDRTGGRWETQSARAVGYWTRTHVCREKRIRLGWRPEWLSRDYCLPGLEEWHLALLMWIRTRAAKHGLDDPPAQKSSGILWTW